MDVHLKMGRSFMHDVRAVIFSTVATTVLAGLLYALTGALGATLPLYPTMGLIATFVGVFALTSGRLKQLGNSDGFFAAFNDLAERPVGAATAVVEASYDTFGHMQKPSADRFHEVLAGVDPDKKYVASLKLGARYDVEAVHTFWSNISLKAVDFVFLITDENGRYLCTLDVWRRFAVDNSRNYRDPSHGLATPYSPTAVELRRLLEAIEGSRASDCKRSWLCQVASAEKKVTRLDAMNVLRSREADILVLTDDARPVGFIRKAELVADIVDAMVAGR